MALSALQIPQRVVYPSSDGQPVAESDFQLRPLLYAVTTLRTYFQERRDVYVGGNMFLYYEEGNPEAVVAPDIFVVLGTANHPRASYMLWQEPKGPDFVLEITSRSTRTKDQGPKRGTYAFLGVSEYFQYDPTHDYLVPPLQGARLVDGNYQALPSTVLPDGTLVVHSEVLGLDLRLEDGTLRFSESSTGQKLLSHAEMAQARQAAEQARQAAEQARQAAEQARQAAEQARQAAEARARQEAEARQTAEARIAALEALLREREHP
ncbi:MAG: Uma2 family endonuclease [Candidatus Tectimicrobiota bacterium]